MSTLADIEEAIAKLPPAEFRQLLQRLNERDPAAWDREIHEDAQSGRLDGLYHRLMAEEGDQPEIPLDQFLDHPKLS